MTISEVITLMLSKCNVSHVFAVPGVNVLPLMNDINKSLNLVVCSCESGAVYMADGYSRVNGMGCCIGTTGPGITNMITGIAGAYYDSIPLIVISSQVAENEYGRYAIQEMTGCGRTPDVIGMLKSVTKATHRIEKNNLSSLFEDILNLFRTSLQGRKGPVYLEVCEDLWSHEVDLENDFSFDFVLPKYQDISIDWQMINTCVSNSENPLVILGNGANEIEYSEIINFIEHIDGYCVSTALAKGKLPHSYKRYLGVIGCYGNYVANTAVESADLIVILGASMGYLSTCGWSLNINKSKTIIRVDIDDTELNRNIIPDFCIHSSTLEFICQFRYNVIKQLAHSKWKTNTFDKHIGHELDSCTLSVDELDPIVVMKLIDSKLIKTENIFVVDVGQNAYWAERYLTTSINHQNGFIIHGGMGAMGYGVAASIGVRIAQRKEKSSSSRVICICGDGGYLMNGLELNTAASYGVDVIWIVMNNSSLGTQKAWSESHDYDLQFENTSKFKYAQNALSQGINSYTVKSYDELIKTLNIVNTTEQAMLIDVCVSNTKYPKSYYGQDVAKVNR